LEDSIPRWMDVPHSASVSLNDEDEGQKKWSYTLVPYMHIRSSAHHCN
jgi:hypothetical protein